MVSITKKFNEKSETKVTPLDIWKHLNTLWDMAEVERLEGLDIKTLGFQCLNEYWEFALNPIEEFDGMVKEIPQEQEETTTAEPQKEAEAPTEAVPVSSESKSTTAKTRRQAARRASSRLNVNTSGVDVTGASAKSSAVEDTGSQNEVEYASEASLASHIDTHQDDEDRGSSTGNIKRQRSLRRTSSREVSPVSKEPPPEPASSPARATRSGSTRKDQGSGSSNTKKKRKSNL
ncbi:hypothetical protein MP638_000591 [Amoeboaphelidium occidentale]|nr:hypothetical protein MP638_000591 [Amoeboaphelidium occidentale]